MKTVLLKANTFCYKKHTETALSQTALSDYTVQSLRISKSLKKLLVGVKTRTRKSRDTVP